MLHGKSNAFAISLKAKLPHDTIFGPLRNTQDVGGLSHGSSFRQVSDDLSLMQ